LDENVKIKIEHEISRIEKLLEDELVPKPGWFWNKLLEKIANSLYVKQLRLSQFSPGQEAFPETEVLGKPPRFKTFSLIEPFFSLS
jgi:hypothetical protein